MLSFQSPLFAQEMPQAIFLTVWGLSSGYIPQEDYDQKKSRTNDIFFSI
jgi:hypothetical protein